MNQEELQKIDWNRILNKSKKALKRRQNLLIVIALIVSSGFSFSLFIARTNSNILIFILVLIICFSIFGYYYLNHFTKGPIHLVKASVVSKIWIHIGEHVGPRNKLTVNILEDYIITPNGILPSQEFIGEFYVSSYPIPFGQLSKGDEEYLIMSSNKEIISKLDIATTEKEILYAPKWFSILLLIIGSFLGLIIIILIGGYLLLTLLALSYSQ